MAWCLGGKGLIFQKNFARSPETKGQIKFQVARIELKFGVMLDRGQVQNVFGGGCPPRSSEVKGKVKIQVASMENKLGKNNAH